MFSRSPGLGSFSRRLASSWGLEMKTRAAYDTGLGPPRPWVIRVSRATGPSKNYKAAEFGHLKKRRVSAKSRETASETHPS
jgi:hypothetical protein